MGENDLKAAQLHTEFFIEDKYYRNYESSKKGTAIWRSLPVEQAIDPGVPIRDFEEAHRVIDEQTSIALVTCPCRSRREKLGVRECKDNNPIGACLFLGISAIMADNMRIGQYVTNKQAKTYIDEMVGMGLVCAGANWSSPPNAVICLCCECCCSQTRGRTRWDNPDAITTSNFIPAQDSNCVYCGKCAAKCMFNAISVDKKSKTFTVEKDAHCPTGCLNKL